MVTRDRGQFDKAMETAVDAAWHGKWEEAIGAYERVLDGSPDDLDALTGLGVAYSNVGRRQEALGVYRRASELAPDDPVLLERVARGLEELGRDEEAAKFYVACGNAYSLQQKPEAPQLAADRWTAAVRLCPDSVEGHVQLLNHYHRESQIDAAVEECLALGRIYADRGRVDHAERICQYAVRLSPGDPRVDAALDELGYGSAPEVQPAPASESEGEPAVDAGSVDAQVLQISVSPEEASRRALGESRDTSVRRARAALAEIILQDPSASTSGAERARIRIINARISRALYLHTQGETEQAIAAYEEAIEAGGDDPAVHFILGLLYQDRRRLDEAVSRLAGAAPDPAYAFHSHLAIGECLHALGKLEEAAHHFAEVLRHLDLATAGAEHAEDLADLYAHYAQRYLSTRNQDGAREFTEAVAGFLDGGEWEEKAKAVRQRLGVLSRERPVVGLAEVLGVRHAERIIDYIAKSQEYVARGLLYAAMETCHVALHFAPNHLALHRQLAEVLVEMGRMDQAVDSFATIADTYAVRGATRHAVGVYERALGFAPMDTSARGRLIRLLVDVGDTDRALMHYVLLADSYYRLAQMEQARQVYQEALRLAPQADKEGVWTGRILHRIGDIDIQRVDWKRAIAVYERLRSLALDDEKARLSLIELYYRVGQAQQAVQVLDELLEFYQREDRTDRLFAVLDDSVDRWPDSMPLRARVAHAHLDWGHTDQALKHLGALAELQLGAGQGAQAATTVRAILALSPPDVDEYRTLLEKIETGQPVDLP